MTTTTTGTGQLEISDEATSDADGEKINDTNDDQDLDFLATAFEDVVGSDDLLSTAVDPFTVRFAIFLAILFRYATSAFL